MYIITSVYEWKQGHVYGNGNIVSIFFLKTVTM